MNNLYGVNPRRGWNFNYGYITGLKFGGGGGIPGCEVKRGGNYTRLLGGYNGWEGVCTAPTPANLNVFL